MAACYFVIVISFNSQPPEGGWINLTPKLCDFVVSTHSHPKAAGYISGLLSARHGVSTHSRPKAAGCAIRIIGIRDRGFNSQPPEGGWLHSDFGRLFDISFQLTAARRRLGVLSAKLPLHLCCFNSQPPEGGWVL